MRSTARIAAVLVLLALSAPGITVAQTPAPTPTVQLTEVSVDRADQRVSVRLKTTGQAHHETQLIESPPRLVIDLADTAYTLKKLRLRKDIPPIKEVRGSQWKPTIARIVVELERPLEYRVDERPDGLVVVLEGSAPAPGGKPAASAGPSTAGALPMAKPEATSGAAKSESDAKRPDPVGKAEPEKKVAQAPKGEAATAAMVSTGARAVLAPVPAQTQAAQPAASNGPKLISLDFKDADIVNLLRILAAESGRNIVAGDDVKGKASVSLHNVTWEQALDTVLEVRGLDKVERGNVIRIVSREQLAKEREAQARAEEALRKAEIETRTKMIEAQIKEADLAAKRREAEAQAAEAQARGPLREETIRLSYADPEEVAKTLQGILGIPPEGTAPVSAAAIPAQPASVPSGTGPLIAEPPFSQLYGVGVQTRQPPLVSVSQEALAKGLTIKAHKPTNTIFIRHYERDIVRIKKLIREQLDVPLPQVKIEARMEILDRNALEAIGVQWGGAFASNLGNTTLIGRGYQNTPGKIPGAPLAATSGVLLPDGTTVLFDPTGTRSFNPAGNSNLSLANLLPVSASTGLPIGGNLVNLPLGALPNAATQIATGGVSFGLIGSNFALNFALEALSTQGKTRTLARPEIVTVENNRAEVSLGEEIPFATVSSAGTQIQFKEALLKLQVTPTVIREKVGEQDIVKIKMIVIVENNSRGDPVNLGAGGTPPAINRRKAETQVLLKEGDRLVIGGVTQSIHQNTVRKVPLFGDLPVLGHLFRHKEDFETGRELVVFVTPSLIRGDATSAAAPRDK